MDEMNVWQVDQRIREIDFKAEDPETGEILDEVLYAELEALQMAREEKVDNLALWVKDLQVFANNLKAEKLAIAERQAKAEAKAEKYKGWLMYFLNGEKPKSAKYQVRYTTSSSVVVSDERQAIDWLVLNGHDDALKVETSIRKDEVKKLLKGGADVPGATLEQRVSMSIK